jgi:hypothetical protein
MFTEADFLLLGGSNPNKNIGLFLVIEVFLFVNLNDVCVLFLYQNPKHSIKNIRLW